VVEAMFGEVIPPSGKPWSALLYFTQDRLDTQWNVASVERSLVEQVKGTPVRLHLTMQLTVLGNPQTRNLSLEGGPHRVPGIGRCESLLLPPVNPFRRFLTCGAPFRQPPFVLARFGGSNEDVSRAAPSVQWQAYYSPFPADFGIDPISDSYWVVPKGASDVTFTIMQPMAHITRELDIPNAQLLEAAP